MQLYFPTDIFRNVTRPSIMQEYNKNKFEKLKH